MDNVLIDTDVLLDFFFDRMPYAHYSTEILLLCRKKQLNAFTTPVIIANTYYLLRKTAKHEMVIDKLNQLLTIVGIIEMNKNVVVRALNSPFKDFEDALQNYSAIEHENINLILTRNIKDYKHSELAILTPESYLKGRNAHNY